MKIECFLISSLLFHACFSCRRETYHDGSIVVVCSNIFSIADLSDLGAEKYLNVTGLIIRNSNISTIYNGSFSKFPNLTLLSLSRHIKHIEAGAFEHLDKLNHLYLSSNQLTELAPGVYNTLSSLELLDAAMNDIEHIENSSLSGLDNLKTLFLQYNKIKKIETYVFDKLIRLKKLDLSWNPLESFNISRLPVTLETLLLSGCRLENSTFTFSLPYINLVSLFGNSIKVLQKPFFKESKNIEILNFGDNRISSISREYFRGVHSLRRLYLNKNNISTIDPGLFQDLENLEKLYLSHNKIERFSYGTFESLKKLTRLEIGHNKLKVLPQYTIFSMPHLKSLDFSNNSVSLCDAEDLLNHHSELKEVSINLNPWNCQDLIHMYEVFVKKGVSILGDRFYDVENFNGITCTSQEEYTNTSKNTEKLLDKMVTEHVQLPHAN